MNLKRLISLGAIQKICGTLRGGEGLTKCHVKFKNYDANTVANKMSCLRASLGFKGSTLN
jgi:hypothetical protein